MNIEFTEKEYGLVNKMEWARGPWHEEPDKVVWVDQATSLDCMIVRNHVGALCGYVGVPSTHRLHGVNYAKVYDYLWLGHSGLTYSAECHGKICHLTDEGDHVWWFGFDCAHSGDLCPMDTMRESEPPYGTYRTLSYVVEQVTKLAPKILHGDVEEEEEEEDTLKRALANRQSRIAGGTLRGFLFSFKV